MILDEKVYIKNSSLFISWGKRGFPKRGLTSLTRYLPRCNNDKAINDLIFRKIS